MTPGGPGASPRYEFGVFASLNSLTNPAAREGGGSLMRPLARIIHERCAFVHNAPAAGPFLAAAVSTPRSARCSRRRPGES